MEKIAAEVSAPILSPADRAHFKQKGFVVVHDVVPRENCEAVIAATFDFLGMDRANPDDWYHEPHRTGGMVEMYQHQALWNNRQHPRVHQLYRELHGTEKLWVSLDRCCFKPPPHPAHPEYDHKGFIHWDAATTTWPLHMHVQGVLALADTAADQGGFQCIPWLYQHFEEWVKTQPPDRDPRRVPLNGLEDKVTPVPMRAGDFVIWHIGLAHGNGHNVTNRPRFCQYISMNPARDDETARQNRIQQWRERIQPQNHSAFPGDPRRWEKKNPPAELTLLGRKLLGLEKWS